MRYLALSVLLFSTWLLVNVAATRQKAVLARRTRKPAGGVSLFPGIPVMPLVFLVVAWILDQLRSDAGFFIVGGLHVMLVTLCVGSILLSVYRLRQVRRSDRD